ncbi:Methyltransferase domain-containing protein [Haloarcula vallismortis]|uniref:Ubiquinone/menaquinone biosynthesis methyltransferase UbiE n=2 Tax=Haloarcula vallismortis TaxID=28442 RepID=M0JEU8_HALVA|nr:class I SAM-dependent methyltransferase [Haloarcula vallismortis]EMA07672.1 ubiquinone/menaquinone biosynthesis methyltransferase UbiE [Haloarcula vallismortis ATCC 29715]SDW74414.1 Methyltransferase domain-containing protein [Haloarcula vallismortis]
MNRRDIVREGYDDIAATYAAKRDGEGRERDLVAGLADRLPAESRVLDAGCGAGVPAMDVLATDHTVTGLDISREQLRTARDQSLGPQFCQGDLAALPFPANTFDAVVSLHTVIHVPRAEHAAVFAEFERVLEPGGRLLAALGDEQWEGNNENWLGTDTEMAWSFHGRKRNRELLTEAGFSVTGVETVDDELGGVFAFFRAQA